jgi:hypothetical protein
MRDDQTADSARYTVFTRTWWIANPAWPNGLEPGAGPRHRLAKNLSYREARELCADWNAKHDPGKFSRKAEFEQQ